MRKNKIRQDSLDSEQFVYILTDLVEAYDAYGYDFNIIQAMALYNVATELRTRVVDAVIRTLIKERPEFVQAFADSELDHIFELFNSDENIDYLDGTCAPAAETLVNQAEELTTNLTDFANRLLGEDPDDEYEDEEEDDDDDCLSAPDFEIEFVDDEEDIPLPDPKQPQGVFSMYDLKEHNADLQARCEKAQSILAPTAPARKLSTKEIYNLLTEKVYKQDEYCRAASVILFNHLRGVNSVNLVSGPTGCGKTFLWEMIRDNLYSHVHFIDGKSITQTGFKGVNLSEVLQTIPFKEGIVVFDEFDKLISASYDSHGTNISKQVQGEFLKVLDSGYLRKTDAGPEFRSTDKITFILCGSFIEKADDKAEEGKSIGFEASLTGTKAYETKVTLEDMIQFGLIKEIAGRITDVVNVNPLTVDDYVAFIRDFNNSAVKQIEDLYGRRIVLSEARIKQIAEESYQNALGLRKAIGIIKSEVNKHIFDENEAEEIVLE